MAKPGISLKQLKIDKANSTIIGVTSATVFIVIFSLLACKSLLGQVGFNNRLATTQQTALNQLKTDVAAKNNLESSYAAFVAPGKNIIGGSSTATGQNDGNNAQIVLDALPSKYDFPALVTSMQNLLGRESVKIDSIGGTDEQLTQQTDASSASPVPVPIPISFTVDGPYQSIENVINDIQNSIRPIQIQSLAISGDESDIQLNVTAQTYYQPEKVFSITQDTVQ